MTPTPELDNQVNRLIRCARMAYSPSPLISEVMALEEHLEEAPESLVVPAGAPEASLDDE